MHFEPKSKSDEKPSARVIYIDQSAIQADTKSLFSEEGNTKGLTVEKKEKEKLSSVAESDLTQLPNSFMKTPTSSLLPNMLYIAEKNSNPDEYNKVESIHRQQQPPILPCKTEAISKIVQKDQKRTSVIVNKVITNKTSEPIMSHATVKSEYYNSDQTPGSQEKRSSQTATIISSRDLPLHRAEPLFQSKVSETDTNFSKTKGLTVEEMEKKRLSSDQTKRTDEKNFVIEAGRGLKSLSGQSSQNIVYKGYIAYLNKENEFGKIAQLDDKQGSKTVFFHKNNVVNRFDVEIELQEGQQVHFEPNSMSDEKPSARVVYIDQSAVKADTKPLFSVGNSNRNVFQQQGPVLNAGKKLIQAKEAVNEIIDHNIVLKEREGLLYANENLLKEENDTYEDDPRPQVWLTVVDAKGNLSIKGPNDPKQFIGETLNEDHGNVHARVSEDTRIRSEQEKLSDTEFGVQGHIHAEVSSELFPNSVTNLDTYEDGPRPQAGNIYDQEGLKGADTEEHSRQEDWLRGKTFISKDEAIKFMKDFSEKSKAAFVIKKSRSGTNAPLVFECKHGKKRASQSKGSRPIQSTVKMGCEAFVRFYVRSSGETVVKAFNLTHSNHVVNEKVFKKDIAKVDEVALDTIKDMVASKCQMIHIKNALESKGIHLSADQIRYQVDNILREPINIQSQKLAEFLQVIKAEGGDVNIQYTPSGTVKVLQIATRRMKEGFMESNSNVIQIDTTYDTNESGYKLSFIVYKNGATGRGEVASMAFLADESEESYRFAFSSFSYLLQKNPTVILIDKVILTRLDAYLFVAYGCRGRVYFLSFFKYSFTIIFEGWTGNGTKTFVFLKRGGGTGRRAVGFKRVWGRLGAHQYS